MKRISKTMAGVIWLCLLSLNVCAQKNIKEFNLAEENILKKLTEDRNSLMEIPFIFVNNTKWPETRIKSQIERSKKALRECESRIVACKKALATLPDAPSSEVNSNGDLREYTQKTFINAWYPDLIKDLKLIIKKLEEGLNEIAQSKVSESTSENSSQNIGNNTTGTRRGAMTSNGSTSGNATAVIGNSTTKEDDMRLASSFEDGLSHIKEGEVFKNDRGEYYQKVNGGARKVDKSTFDRIQANRVAEQLASQEAQRQERNAVYNRAVEDVTNLGVNAVMSIRADREARLEREYSALRRADEDIKTYSPLATDGDAEALKKVNNAYYTLAYYNKEEKNGWNGMHSKRREAFLQNTLEKTKNPIARDLLFGFYDEQKEEAMARKRKAIGRTIGLPLLGVGMAVGGYFGYNKLDIYENGEYPNEGIALSCLVTGIVGFATFATWGIAEGVSISSKGENSDSYKKADQKQKSLARRFSWSLTPKYDPRFNASMLNLNITF